MSKSMIELLNDRIERNYEDFKAETIATLSNKGIFELAGHISAVEDVRLFVSTHDWFDENEVDYLLSFANPLEVLANEWEDMLSNSGCSFGAAVDRLFERDDDDPDEDDYYD